MNYSFFSSSSLLLLPLLQLHLLLLLLLCFVDPSDAFAIHHHHHHQYQYHQHHKANNNILQSFKHQQELQQQNSMRLTSSTIITLLHSSSSSSNTQEEEAETASSSSSSSTTSSSTTTTTSSSSTTTATTTTPISNIIKNDNDDDLLLKPSYEIEKIPLRIGHGFDIHRMVPLEEAKQPIIIGGVIIDHSPLQWIDQYGRYVETKGDVYETKLGILAHSDGDVIYHSIVDAIFGALTLPDIGQVFQDTDPQWKGCESFKFMEYAYQIMKSYGYQVGNVDVTLILERPKVASYKLQMKENIVRLLRTTPGRVNIKARTHEQMDSIGELRSLSCHVVLTLELEK